MDFQLEELSELLKRFFENVLNGMENTGPGYFLTSEDCKLLLFEDESLKELGFDCQGRQGYPQSPLYHAIALAVKDWMDSGNFGSVCGQQFELLDDSQSRCVMDDICRKAEPVIQDMRDNWGEKCLSSKQDTVSILLERIGKRGLLYLLGVRHTVGSVDVFPPPLSALWGSFNKKHKEKSNLTVGARALSKHCHRDLSSKWWGECTGSEHAKNEHASNILMKILSSSAWVNVHILPHDVVVLEVRHSEGYGARWSSDGAQFRGFLEPQMEEGHSSKWRH